MNANDPTMKLLRAILECSKAGYKMRTREEALENLSLVLEEIDDEERRLGQPRSAGKPH